MPRYAVSACLAGHACRYDGKSSPCSAVITLVEQGDAVPYCPEQLGGLPTPRVPCERRGNRIIDRNGIDRTANYKDGAETATSDAISKGCTAAILKSRSPSCGCGRIYDGTFTHTLTDGNGTWAESLKRAGFILYSEEDLPPSD